MEKMHHKFVAVLNKKAPISSVLNALGHMAAGLVGSYPDSKEMCFATYVDKDGGEHKSISDFPFIILQADNANQLRTLRNKLLETDIHFVDFTSTMTIGTYAEQQERTQNTPEAELEYYGLCAFGLVTKLNPLIKKYSLWK
jgi:hypothetical protein